MKKNSSMVCHMIGMQSRMPSRYAIAIRQILLLVAGFSSCITRKYGTTVDSSCTHQCSPTEYRLVHNNYDAGATSVTSFMSITGKTVFFFTSQILFLMLNFSTIWLVGRWLTLATQRWNRNQVCSIISPKLVMLHWRECHIVNQAYHCSCTTVYTSLIRHWMYG